MTEYKTMDDLGDLHGKVVMLRADLNVPMDENFHVTNTARIDRTVPTIKELKKAPRLWLSATSAGRKAKAT